MKINFCFLFISYALAIPIEDFETDEVFLGHERELESLDKGKILRLKILIQSRQKKPKTN